MDTGVMVLANSVVLLHSFETWLEYNDIVALINLHVTRLWHEVGMSQTNRKDYLFRRLKPKYTEPITGSLKKKVPSRYRLSSHFEAKNTQA